jgi:integrase
MNLPLLFPHPSPKKASCDRPAQNETANYRYIWTGEDLADFISVSVYTGLRISDVAMFHIDRLLKNGECHVRTTKTGRKVYTWISEWLQERIRARVAKYGPLIFGAHETTDLNVITDLWRRRLNRLWDLCEPWKSKPHPPRFRHTFARILLQKPGVTVRDVAEFAWGHGRYGLEALRCLGPRTARTTYPCTHGSIR